MKLPVASADQSPCVWRDLGIVAIAVVSYFVLAVTLELSEAVAGFTRKYERWQLDELALTLLWFSLGLSWFAFRRIREVRLALAQRIEAQAQVAALLVHNRELAQRLIVVQENERRVLARDLHDEIGQNCTAIRAEARFILHAGDCAHAQTLDDANAWASPGGPMMASAQRIEHAAQILHAMVHDMLLRLRPPALDSLGLEAALQTLCESWETQSGIACGFFPVNLPVQLGDATAVAVFRLVQESLTNVARHAGATQVIVRLSRTIDGTRLRLHVQDDGCGLVEGSARKSHTALGQMGMRERVAALQGTIDFVSQPGAGLCVSVEMPLVVEESLS